MRGVLLSTSSLRRRGKGALYREGVSELLEALGSDEIVFHAGCIRGAFPRVLDDR